MVDKKNSFYKAISKLQNPDFEIVQELPSGSHTAPKIIRMSDGLLAVLKQPQILKNAKDIFYNNGQKIYLSKIMLQKLWQIIPVIYRFQRQYIMLRVPQVT